MNGYAAKARKYMIDADNSNNSREKVMFYVNAAKEYAKAVDTVTDPVVKASLAYLSVSATQKAQLIQSIIQQYSSDNVLQLEQANRAMGKAKPSGPISEVSDNVHDNRLIFKAHQSRLAGINKVPKFTPPSDSNAVKDLLALESRLNELGFRRNGTDSGSTVPHRNIKISSDLGESFMVLKPGGPANLSTSVVSAVSPSEATTPILERRASLNSNYSSDDSVSSGPYGGGNTVKIRNLVNSSPQGSVGSASSGGSATSTLAAPLAWAATTVLNMNWGGFTSAPNPITADNAAAAKGINGNNWVDDDYGEAGELNWNEQSLFNPGAVNPSIDPYTPAKNVPSIVPSTKKTVLASGEHKSSSQRHQQHHQNPPALTQEQRHFYDVMAQSTNTIMSASTASGAFHHPLHPAHHNSAMVGDEGLTRSAINTINSSAQENSEGVVKLLGSIQRLSEENAALVSRIEQLEKVEEENKKIITEMEVFRMDYEDKFKRVKKVLKEYAAKFPHGGNPVTEAFEAVSQQQQQQQQQPTQHFGQQMQQINEKEAAKALASMAAGETKSEKSGDGAAASGTTTGVPTGSVAEVKRMKDLERTVNALVSRLQHANDEIRRRDGILTKLDPQYVSTIQPPPKHSSRPPSGGNPHSSSGSSSSTREGGIAQASANSGRSSTGSSSGGGGGGVVMSRIGMAAGTLSPVPPKKQISAPVARHSGAATLESLQQKNKNAF